MHRLFVLFVMLLVLAGCGSSPAIERVSGSWRTEGALITLDTTDNSYIANVGGQNVRRSFEITSSSDRSVTMQLDNGRELVATFAPDSWDTVTMGITDNWEFTFERVK